MTTARDDVVMNHIRLAMPYIAVIHCGTITLCLNRCSGIVKVDLHCVYAQIRNKSGQVLAITYLSRCLSIDLIK